MQIWTVTVELEGMNSIALTVRRRLQYSPGRYGELDLVDHGVFCSMKAFQAADANLNGKV